ncbi:hypothetical protein KIPB_002701 [Kipferlia bialata]|uniref:Uncharacterized protein n=1 Tax=Kipferlia bialata TaxID=797122 RepID=A0A9K3GGV4_9EUKA|nr:hypothetical protein KIPB_002701 [Kipferlia bialata]|eukprot:g2701.t1
MRRLVALLAVLVAALCGSVQLTAGTDVNFTFGRVSSAFVGSLEGSSEDGYGLLCLDSLNGDATAFLCGSDVTADACVDQYDYMMSSGSCMDVSADMTQVVVTGAPGAECTLSLTKEPIVWTPAPKGILRDPVVTPVTDSEGEIQGNEDLGTDNTWVVYADTDAATVTSVQIGIHSDVDPTDSLSLFVAHWDSETSSLSQDKEIYADFAADGTSDPEYVLTFDYAEDPATAINCWYMQFVVHEEEETASDADAPTGFTATYTSYYYNSEVEYDVEGAYGTVTNGNYYNNERDNWVITRDHATSGSLICTGATGGETDTLTIATGLCDGMDVTPDANEVTVLSGAISMDDSLVVDFTPETTNCFSLLWETDDDCIGAGGFTCDYTVASAMTTLHTDGVDFSSERYEPYALDTYIIGTELTNDLIFDVSITGAIADTAVLKVYSGVCKGETPVGEGTLLDTVAGGAIDVSESVILSTGDDGATACVYFTLDTQKEAGTVSDEGVEEEAFTCTYSTQKVETQTWITEMGPNTFTNTRYLSTQDDTFIVFPDTPVASVALSVDVTAMADTDSLSLSVAHCAGGNMLVLPGKALDVDFGSDILLTLDVDGTDDSLNCWVLEFVTDGADATDPDAKVFSAIYTCTEYTATDDVIVLVEDSGDIDPAYYNSQSTEWVVTSDAMAGAQLTCQGTPADGDVFSVHVGTCVDDVYTPGTEVVAVEGVYDVAFAAPHDSTNCFIVDWTTNADYLGGDMVTCEYTVTKAAESSALFTDLSGTVVLGDYVPYMTSTYIMAPNMDTEDATVGVTGTIDATASLSLYQGMCSAEGVVQGDGVLISDAASGDIDIETTTVTYTLDETGATFPCMYIVLETAAEATDGSAFSCTYSFDKSLKHWTTAMSGTLTNTRYEPTATDYYIVAPDTTVASVSLSVDVTAMGDEDLLSLYAGHCDDGTLVSMKQLMVDFSSDIIVTLDVADVTDLGSLNCWLLEFDTNGATVPEGETDHQAFSADYTCVAYTADGDDDQVILTDATGTVTPTNYYNDQHNEWVVTSDAMAGASVTCTGAAGPGDTMTVWTGVYDGEAYAKGTSVDAVDGVYTIAFADVHDATNAFSLVWDTDSDCLGGDLVTCEYTLTASGEAKYHYTETAGTFDSERYVEYMKDTYIISPNMDADSASIAVTGTIDDSATLSLYAGVCMDNEVVGDGTLVGDAIGMSTVINFEVDVAGLPCLYLVLETEADSTDDMGFTCTYAFDPYSTTTWYSDMTRTISNSRYEERIDDLYVVFPEPAVVSSVSLSVDASALVEGVDTLSLYVAHCADAGVTGEKALDVDFASDIMLTLDVDGADTSLNCWYLEFTTVGADVTDPKSFSATYTCTEYFPTVPIAYLSAVAGTIELDYSNNQHSQWVVTADVASAEVTCYGTPAAGDALTVFAGVYDGVTPSTATKGDEVTAVEGVYTIDFAAPHANTNCFFVDWVTGSEYLGEAVTCEYTVTPSVEAEYTITDVTSTFASERYVAFMDDTYVIRPKLDSDAATVSVSGTLDVDATLSVYQGVWDGETVTDGVQIYTVTGGDIDLEETEVTFTVVAEGLSPCLYLTLETNAAITEGMDFSCTYAFEAYASQSWTEEPEGQLVSARYEPRQDDTYVVSAGADVTSVTVTMTSVDIDEATDALSLYVAHCGTKEEAAVSNPTLISEQVVSGGVTTLTFDYGSEAEDSINCWYMEFVTEASAATGKGFTVDYVSKTYVPTDDVVYIDTSDAVSGTITNINYYNDQHNQWVLTNTNPMMAATVLSLSGLNGDNSDHLSIYKATCEEGEDPAVGDLVYTYNGSFDVTVTAGFDEYYHYDPSNCVVLHWDTDSDSIGAEDFNCDYTVTPLKQTTYTTTAQTGRVTSARFVPYMQDTYVISPNLDADSASVSLSGDIGFDGADLALYQGVCMDGEVVGEGTVLAEWEFGTAISYTKDILFEVDPAGLPCLYIVLETMAGATEGSFAFEYSFEAYETAVWYSDMARTISNSRYEERQDDKYVVFPEPAVVSSVSLTVDTSAMNPETDSLSLYVAHCAAADVTNAEALEVDFISEVVITLDVDGADTSMNCWYLEFTTDGADVTDPLAKAFTAEYACEQYYPTVPLVTLTEATGTITPSTYHNDQHIEWVVTSDAMAHFELSCTGMFGEGDVLTAYMADYIDGAVQNEVLATTFTPDDRDVMCARTFEAYVDTNCFTVHWDTNTDYLGGDKFTCEYVVQPYVEETYSYVEEAGTITQERYIEYAKDTYLLVPDVDTDAVSVTLSGTIDTTATLSLYQGVCDDGEVVGEGTLIDTSSGDIDVSHNIQFHEAGVCVWATLETELITEDGMGFSIEYVFESFSTTTWISEMTGSVSNSRYEERQDDIFVIFPEATIASVSLSVDVSAMDAETDSLTLSVAHCDGQVKTLGKPLVVDFTSDITLTLDVEGADESLNCWTLQFVTDGADVTDPTAVAFTADYTCNEYTPTDDVITLTDVHGTITPTNYFNNQHKEWVVTSDAMAATTFGCTGLSGEGDTVSIYTSESEEPVWTDSGDIDFEGLIAGFALYQPSNSVSLHWDTNSDYLGAEGVTCDYTVTEYTTETLYSDTLVDSMVSARYESYILDTYVMAPDANVDEGTFTITGTISTDAVFKVYQGLFDPKAHTIVGKGTLLYTSDAGEIDFSDSVPMDAPSDEGRRCVYMTLQTALVGDDTTGLGFQCDYVFETFSSTQWITDAARVFTNTRYEERQDDTYVVFPADPVASVSITIDASGIDQTTDSLSLFVAHCEDGAMSKGHFIASEFTDEPIVLTLDVDGGEDSRNCWALEFETEGSAATGTGFTATYASSMYTASPAIITVTEDSGKFDHESYYNNQSQVWVITNDAMALASVKVMGDTGDNDVVSLYSASWDGTTLSDEVLMWSGSGKDLMPSVDFSFDAMVPTNAVSVHFDTNGDYLGDVGFIVEYTVTPYTEETYLHTEVVTEFVNERYEAYAIDTYVMNPSLDNIDAMHVAVTGTIAPTDTITVFSGLCLDDVVVDAGTVVATQTGEEALAISADLFLDPPDVPPTFGTQCMYVVLEVPHDVNNPEDMHFEVTYAMESYSTTVWFDDLAGTFSNTRYEERQQDSFVVHPDTDGMLASATVTIVTDIDATTDSVGFYVAHCDVTDEGVQTVSSRKFLTNEFTADPVYLSLDLEDEESNRNCWLIQFSTQDSAHLGTGFTATYESQLYVDEEPVIHMTDAAGTVSPTNYYNNQSSEWIVTGDAMANVQLTCTGVTHADDVIEVYSGTWDGTDATERKLEWSYSGVIGERRGTFEIEFYAYEPSNCFTVHFDTNGDYIGDAGFSCEYSTSSYTKATNSFTDEVDSFDTYRYESYIEDTYLMYTDNMEALSAGITVTGTLSDTAMVMLYSGLCATGSVISRGELVDTVAGGAVDIAQSFSFPALESADSGYTCLILVLDTKAESDDVTGMGLSVDYYIQSYATETWMDAASGSISNSRYIHEQDDLWIVYPDLAMASASLSIYATDIDATDSLTVSVAHCEDGAVTLAQPLVVDFTSDVVLTLDVEGADESLNCWTLEFVTVQSAAAGMGFSCDYTMAAYTPTDDMTVLADASGVIANSDYYNNESKGWAVMSSQTMASATVSCTGSIKEGDTLSLYTAVCDGQTIVDGQQIWSGTGGLDVVNSLSFPEFDNSNCFTMHFETDGDYLGDAGFSCEYDTTVYTSATYLHSDDTGSFSSERYVPYMHDTYVMDTTHTEATSAEITLTGTISETATLSLYTGMCVGEFVQPDGTLVQTVSGGDVLIAETFSFDAPETDTTPTPCMYYTIQTAEEDTPSDMSVQCDYVIEPYATTTLITSMSGTVTNDRYLFAQDDVYVMNPAQTLAAVHVSITSYLSGSDEVLFYVGHCGTGATVTNTLLMDVQSDFTLAFDADSEAEDSINCWYIEFVTEDSPATGTGFSIEYDSVEYVETPDVVTLTDATGTISIDGDYYNNMNKSWIVKGDSLGHATVTLSGVTGGSEDTLIVSQAVCEGDDVSDKFIEYFTYGVIAEHTFEFTFHQYAETNCFTVDFVTDGDCLGGSGFTLDYKTADYSTDLTELTAASDNFSPRYISYMQDRYVMNPSISNPDAAGFKCTGTIGTSDEATFSLYTGWCEDSTVVGESVLVTTQSGALDINESINYDVPSARPTADAMNCMYVDIETMADVGDNVANMQCSYYMESYDTTTTVVDMAGTLTNERYLSRQYDTWIMAPVATNGVASVSASFSLDMDLDHGDSLSLFSGHYNAATGAFTMGRTIAADVEATTYELTMDINAEEADTTAANCWYLVFVTDSAEHVGSGFTATYESHEYIPGDNIVTLTDPTGVISNVNYYNDQHNEWIVTSDIGMASAHIVCTGSSPIRGGDYLTVASASCTGGKVDYENPGSVQWVGDLDQSLDIVFDEFVDSNCFTLHWDTNSDGVGAEGFSCQYEATAFSMVDHAIVGPSGTVFNDRYIPFMDDRYAVEVDSMKTAELTCTGSIDETDSYLNLFYGACDPSTGAIVSVADSKVESVTGSIDFSATMEFDKSDDEHAQPCFILELTTDGNVSNRGSEFSCHYTTTIRHSFWYYLLIVYIVLSFLAILAVAIVIIGGITPPGTGPGTSGYMAIAGGDAPAAPEDPAALEEGESKGEKVEGVHVPEREREHVETPEGSEGAEPAFGFVHTSEPVIARPMSEGEGEEADETAPLIKDE